MKIFLLLALIFTVVIYRNAEAKYPIDTDDVKPATCVTVNDTSGTCKPLHDCIFLISIVDHIGQYKCALSGDALGVCCPSDVSVPVPVPTVADGKGDLNLTVPRNLTAGPGSPEEFHKKFLKNFKAGSLFKGDDEKTVPTVGDEGGSKYGIPKDLTVGPGPPEDYRTKFMKNFKFGSLLSSNDEKTVPTVGDEGGSKYAKFALSLTEGTDPPEDYRTKFMKNFKFGSLFNRDDGKTTTVPTSTVGDDGGSKYGIPKDVTERPSPMEDFHNKFMKTFKAGKLFQSR